MFTCVSVGVGVCAAPPAFRLWLCWVDPSGFALTGLSAPPYNPPPTQGDRGADPGLAVLGESGVGPDSAGGGGRGRE
jgi:hypothetical protein